MKITLSVNGYLSRFFGQSQYELVLEEGSTLTELLFEIDSKFGAALPKSVWAHDKKRFRGPVSVSVGEEIVRDMAYPLQDGQQIAIARFLIGG